MKTDYPIRPMQPSDSPALMTLEAKTADTGRVGFRASYKYDFYTTQLVWIGMMSFGTCQVEGELRPYAYFGGLGVHEDFRRKGIASLLATERIVMTRQRIGPDGIIFAGIQGTNVGSLKTAMKWANQKEPGDHCKNQIQTTQTRQESDGPGCIRK